MEDLDCELVGLVVRQCAPVMQPFLGLVSRKWLQAASDVRRADRCRNPYPCEQPLPRIDMNFDECIRYDYCPTHDCCRGLCHRGYVLGLVGGGHLALLKWLHEFGLATLPDRTAESAAPTGSVPLLAWLVEVGCNITDKVSRRAARRGHVHVLEWIQRMGFKQSKRLMAEALKGGHGHLFEWLYRQRRPTDLYPYKEAALVGRTDLLERFEHNCANHKDACYAACYGAAARGDVALIEWLRGRGYEIAQFACYEAATHGHLAALQHLMGIFDGRTDGWVRSDVCEGAAFEGHFHIVQWLYERGWASDADRIYCAVHCDQEDAIRWLQTCGLATRQALSNTACALVEAAACGSVRMLAFMHDTMEPSVTKDMLYFAIHERKWPAAHWVAKHMGGDSHRFGIKPYKAAIATGQLAMVEWLRDQGRWAAPECARLFAHAAKQCHLGTLRWLRDRGCPWDASAPVSACEFKRPRSIATLRWLHKHGCPFDARVSITAAGYGDVEILQWVVTSGIPWHRARCRQLALQLRHSAVVEWIDARPFDARDADARYDSFQPLFRSMGDVHTWPSPAPVAQ